MDFPPFVPRLREFLEVYLGCGIRAILSWLQCTVKPTGTQVTLAIDCS
jgi:hypothetical protein